MSTGSTRNPIRPGERLRTGSQVLYAWGLMISAMMVEMVFVLLAPVRMDQAS